MFDRNSSSVSVSMVTSGAAEDSSACRSFFSRANLGKERREEDDKQSLPRRPEGLSRVTQTLKSSEWQTLVERAPLAWGALAESDNAAWQPWRFSSMNNCSLGSHQHSSVPMPCVRRALRHGGLHRPARTHKQSSPNTRARHRFGVPRLRLICSSAKPQKHLQVQMDHISVARSFVGFCTATFSLGQYFFCFYFVFYHWAKCGGCCSAHDGNIMWPGHCIYMMGRGGTRRHCWETSTCILLRSHDSSPAAGMNYSIFAVTQWEKTSEVKDGGVCAYEREWAIWSRKAEEKLVWWSQEGVRANLLEMKPLKKPACR